MPKVWLHHTAEWTIVSLICLAPLFCNLYKHTNVSWVLGCFQQEHFILLPVVCFLANLFLLISSILGSKMAGPHTQFVQSFMEECVVCLEQGSRRSILQFMPFTMVSSERRGQIDGDKVGCNSFRYVG